MQKPVQLGFVVILATGINIEHSIPSLLARPSTDIEGLIGTGDSLDDFGIGELPVLVGGRPAPTIDWPINIVIPVE